MSSSDDQTWAELVRNFNAPSTPADPPPSWPDAENIPADDPDAADKPDEWVMSTSGGLAMREPGESTASDTSDTAPPGDDHFVPPPPPPLPRGDLVSRLAWAGVIGGPAVLLTTVIWPWFGEGMLFLAASAFVAGFVTLLARLRGHHPNDPDTGAVT